MAKLDKSKPYEEVFGHDPAIPFTYVQDGAYFDASGKEVKWPPKDTASSKAPTPAPAPAPTSTDPAQNTDPANPSNDGGQPLV
jgi:hypothetical protein